MENLPRLNTPGRRRSWWPRLPFRHLSVRNIAEGLSRILANPVLVVGVTIGILVWLIINFIILIVFHYDPYPILVLNLLLSALSACAAPLILFTNQRQGELDRIALEQEREMAAQARADTEFLAREVASLRMRMAELATRDFIRSELRDLFEEFEEGLELQQQLRAKRSEDEESAN